MAEPNDDGDWSRAAGPESAAAPMTGRGRSGGDDPTAATRGTTEAGVSQAMRRAPTKVERRWRIVYRVFVLLAILGWGGAGLVAFTVEAFEHSRVHYEMLPPAVALLVVVPMAIYGLFGRVMWLRLAACGGAAGATLSATVLMTFGLFVVLQRGFRLGEELPIVAGLWLGNGLGAVASILLLRLEVDLRRPARSAGALAWEMGGPAGGLAQSTGGAAAALNPLPPVPGRWVRRGFAVVPVIGYAGLMVFFWLLASGFSRPVPAYMAMGLTVVLGLLLTVVAFMRWSWLRMLSQGINLTAAIGWMAGLMVGFLEEHRHRWGRSTTFGFQDPNLLLFLLWIGLWVAFAGWCGWSALYVLRWDLAEFERTATARGVAAAKPEKEEDLVNAGDWDQGRG